MKENFAPPHDWTYPYMGRVTRVTVVAVRRRRRRAGRRRHRVESRPPRARGDAAGTHPARRPRRQFPRVRADLPLRLPRPLLRRPRGRARAGFDELERLSGRRLITPSGALDFGPARRPRPRRVLEAVGVEHELLSAAEARARWPQIAVDSETLWHPGAGVIDAEGTVSALLEQAPRHGAQVLTGWPVGRVAATSTGYRLATGDGRTIDAEQIVITAGGWLPALLDRLPLPAGFRALLPPLQVSQENAFHFPYREEAAGSWPTFIHRTPAIQTYGLPGGRDAGFRGQKIAEFIGGRRIASAADQDGVVDPANRARMVDHVRQYLPGLVPEPYAETTCLFTSTPTEDFVIDGADGITLVSPCSGHGAKFAPLIGDIAADVATGTGRPPSGSRCRRRTWPAVPESEQHAHPVSPCSSIEVCRRLSAVNSTRLASRTAMPAQPRAGSRFVQDQHGDHGGDRGLEQRQGGRGGRGDGRQSTPEQHVAEEHRHDGQVRHDRQIAARLARSAPR